MVLKCSRQNVNEMTKNHRNYSAASHKIAYEMEKEVKKQNKQKTNQKNDRTKRNTKFTQRIANSYLIQSIPVKVWDPHHNQS